MTGADSAQTQYTPPTEAEAAWMAGHVQWLESAGVDLSDPQHVAGAYDDLLAAWLAEPEPRSDPNNLVNVLGTAFGECLVRTLPLSWTVAIDEQGAELAVRGDGMAVQGLVLYPANAVAKRWVKGEDGAFITFIWAEAARVLTIVAPENSRL